MSLINLKIITLISCLMTLTAYAYIVLYQTKMSIEIPSLFEISTLITIGMIYFTLLMLLGEPCQGIID